MSASSNKCNYTYGGEDGGLGGGGETNTRVPTGNPNSQTDTVTYYREKR